ncbi:MAG: S8 family serine peptidase [Planctomycetes bacterium]|nr:S8 family serine peptidase [Planctomycetota bacterium]
MVRSARTARLDEDLRVMGVARVIVLLNPSRSQPAAAAARGATGGGIGAEYKALERHFTSSERSQTSALLRELERAPSSMAARFMSAASKPGRGSRAPIAQPPMRVYARLGVMLGTVREEGLRALLQDTRIHSVGRAPEFSLIRPLSATRTTLKTRVTWGLTQLGVPALWAKGLTGKGVLVGHLDTGVDAGHPALRGAVQSFALFDYMGNEVAGAQPQDSDEHGTHTAGTIAGRKVRGNAFGVAPEAKLASALVIEGGDVVARVLGGMDWAVGQGVRVLSMSLGLRGYHPDFQPVTQQLRALGVLPVFASGNEGPGTSRSPGNYPEALSVGASDARRDVASFSSSQQFARPEDPLVPDVIAPGDDVLSCVPGKKYSLMSGTSMATPHVAGLAALLAQAKPAATPDQLEDAIFRSCSLPPGVPADRANRGIPDGLKALELLAGP